MIEFFRKIKNSPVELFGVIFFKDNGVVGTHILGEGTDRGVNINVSRLFREAENLGAQGMTLVHNHPSGILRPSIIDLKTTYTLQDYCKPKGIPIIDHIILGNNTKDHYSFKKNGAL